MNTAPADSYKSPDRIISNPSVEQIEQYLAFIKHAMLQAKSLGASIKIKTDLRRYTPPIEQVINGEWPEEIDDNLITGVTYTISIRDGLEAALTNW